MSNISKVIISSILVAIVITMLFLVVPISENFIISYIFALIAITGIATSLIVFNKKNTKAPMKLAFVYTSVIYFIINIIFSSIACINNLIVEWTIVLHVAIFVIFIIIAIALLAGNEHVNKLDEETEIKNEKFKEEKKDYWK